MLVGHWARIVRASAGSSTSTPGAGCATQERSTPAPARAKTSHSLPLHPTKGMTSRSIPVLAVTELPKLQTTINLLA